VQLGGRARLFKVVLGGGHYCRDERLVKCVKGGALQR
jgi:hypothetical protein